MTQFPGLPPASPLTHFRGRRHDSSLSLLSACIVVSSLAQAHALFIAFLVDRSLFLISSLPNLPLVSSRCEMSTLLSPFLAQFFTSQSEPTIFTHWLTACVDRSLPRFLATLADPSFLVSSLACPTNGVDRSPSRSLTSAFPHLPGLPLISTLFGGWMPSSAVPSGAVLTGATKDVIRGFIYS